MASASAVECTATVGNAKLLAGAQHAQCDLAAIGDEDFFEHHSMIIIGSPNSTGWPSSTRICVTVPERGAGNRIHRLHRFDDQQRFAGFHRLPDIDERTLAGRGREICGADHRRWNDTGMLGRIVAQNGHHRCRRGMRQRRSRHALRHARGTSDADAFAAALDFDLGQAGLVEKFGEAANGGLVIGRRRRLLIQTLVVLVRRHGQPFACWSNAASPSIAAA